MAPWPWTINALENGRYYDSAAEAASNVTQYLARGISVVDVGCMQVDLFHHPHAFHSVNIALDPKENVAYAAKYLLKLERQYGSWTKAIAAYHAGNPANGADYVARVLYFWKGKPMDAEADSAGRPRGFAINAVPVANDVAAEFYVRHDFNAAAIIYRAELKIDPNGRTALLGLAEILLEQRHVEEAQGLFERVLSTDPNNETAQTALLTLAEAAPPSQWLERLRSLHRLSPEAPQIIAHLALAEAAAGNSDDALVLMADAVQRNPAAVNRLNYALLIDRAGGSAAAAAAYETFLQNYRPGEETLTISLDQVRDRLAFLRKQAQ